MLFIAFIVKSENWPAHVIPKVLGICHFLFGPAWLQFMGRVLEQKEQQTHGQKSLFKFT